MAGCMDTMSMCGAMNAYLPSQAPADVCNMTRQTVCETDIEVLALLEQKYILCICTCHNSPYANAKRFAWRVLCAVLADCLLCVQRFAGTKTGIDVNM